MFVAADQDNVEALIALMAANEMKSMGKGEKALKLIEHGIALAPKNPDLLNCYGELIETIRHDVVIADQMYFQVYPCFTIEFITFTYPIRGITCIKSVYFFKL